MMILSWSEVGEFSTTSRLNSRGGFVGLFGGYGEDSEERRSAKALLEGGDEG
jgi:hypothetical protein